MTNTPTESEFDKELKLMIDEIGHAGANGDDRKGTQTIYLKAIKQAVDKQVDQLQTYKFTDVSEDEMVMLNDVKALYGGDKK